jgi:hypothetical protein
LRCPFGNGYFFSWWLARIPRVLLDFVFLFCSLAFGSLLMKILAKGGEDGSPGCLGVFLAPLAFFGLLFLLGLFVRYGDSGLEPTVLSMPITGFLYGLVFRPVTYFNEDTALMFQEAVQSAVLEAIEGLRASKGLRALSYDERKPSLRNLLK